MRFLMIVFLILPGFVLAAGSDTGSPPVKTQTSKNCKGVQVWDKKTKTCVNPQDSSLDQHELMEAVRELAYAGRNKGAQVVLRHMANQNDDLVLTYWGFTNRKLGKRKLANEYYARAIAQNPDNLLARSYMAQGFVSEGRKKEAVAQLTEIRARGGTGTWAEASLSKAIRTGKTYNN